MLHYGDYFWEEVWCTGEGGLQTTDAWVPTPEYDLIDLDFGQVQEDFSKAPQVILTCSENHC